MNKQGFTLIELLIVISVVGILAAAILVLINPAGQISKAQDAQVKSNLSSIQRIIDQERAARDKVLKDITKHGCSDCDCRYCRDLRSESTCLNRMNSSWNNVIGKDMPKDPWGNVYVFDENEWEGGTSDCRRDYLRSGGPDHVMNDPSNNCASSDDIVVSIAPYKCP